MPRKLRLEFPGAIYHIINRGNYRSWIFENDRTKLAFESCLFEACTRSGWLLHAFVIMDNHFHLAVETPGGNIVAGMQWLQSTFANRFNRFRQVHGHLFQGRYKSILIEPGAWLGRVCHYIHLNLTRIFREARNIRPGGADSVGANRDNVARPSGRRKFRILHHLVHEISGLKSAVEPLIFTDGH